MKAPPTQVRQMAAKTAMFWVRVEMTPKTTMKVSRYRARGSTQRRGMAARSVVMYVVTPSIRLEGTIASAIHRIFLDHATDSPASRSPVGGGTAGGACLAACLLFSWVTALFS